MSRKNTLPSTREQIASVQAQIDEPANYSMSHSELAVPLAAAVDEWAARGADLVADQVQRVGAGLGASDLLRPDARAYEHNGVVDLLRHSNDVRALTVWMVGKEAVLARLKSHIGTTMPEGLDADARAKRLADLRRQLIGLEVTEEKLIRDAEAQGIDWDPRPEQPASAAILIRHGNEQP